MVTNSQGDTVGPDGSSRSLTKGADRALVGIYRDVADAVVVGATTLRRERVPTPQQSVLVVLTQTGDMSGHQLVYRDGGEVIVVTRAVARDPLSDTFNDVPHTPLYLEPSELTSPTAILDHVSRVRPAGSVLVEGGRRTWELFAPITDEVCVTVRPPLTHDDAGIPSWWPGERSSWDLQTLWTDDEKMLYYRYLTGASARPQLS